MARLIAGVSQHDPVHTTQPSGGSCGVLHGAATERERTVPCMAGAPAAPLPLRLLRPGTTSAQTVPPSTTPAAPARAPLSRPRPRPRRGRRERRVPSTVTGGAWRRTRGAADDAARAGELEARLDEAWV